MTLAFLLSILCVAVTATRAFPSFQAPLIHDDEANNTISTELFVELEELARIVDISYCVGMTGAGIQKPFQCLSRCSDFESFELVKTFNTGPLLSDSCGYIALSHPPAAPRVIVAFRGTYSIANTIADLSTVPQEYIPYPGDDDEDESNDDGEQSGSGFFGLGKMVNRLWSSKESPPQKPPKCDNCTVHTGFYTSWLNTKDAILPELTEALLQYPNYTLTLVGHSLGGAVAALASLDFKARGWNPRVTTFGEPRVGNKALNQYIDMRFGLPSNGSISVNSTFRRITHASDPVPLLPLEEWGYSMHAGEIFISKQSLPPEVTDLRHCIGDEDHDCIAGSDEADPSDVPPDEKTPTGPADLWEFLTSHRTLPHNQDVTVDQQWAEDGSVSDRRWWDSSRFKFWPVPARYKLWQLFFAHRDYFWRIGLCVPGGDPKDWYRKYPHQGDGREEL